MSSPCKTCGSIMCGDICTDLPLTEQLQLTREASDKFEELWLEARKEIKALNEENRMLKTELNTLKQKQILEAGKKFMARNSGLFKRLAEEPSDPATLTKTTTITSGRMKNGKDGEASYIQDATTTYELWEMTPDNADHNSFGDWTITVSFTPTKAETDD